MSNTTIPTIQISKNFGKISKIIFFQVSNTINGSFNVNLFITHSQISETKISIVNKNSKTTLYNKTYGKSPNTNTIGVTRVVLDKSNLIIDLIELFLIQKSPKLSQSKVGKLG